MHPKRFSRFAFTRNDQSQKWVRTKTCEELYNHRLKYNNQIHIWSTLRLLGVFIFLGKDLLILLWLFFLLFRQTLFLQYLPKHCFLVSVSPPKPQKITTKKIVIFVCYILRYFSLIWIAVIWWYLIEAIYLYQFILSLCLNYNS